MGPEEVPTLGAEKRLKERGEDKKMRRQWGDQYIALEDRREDCFHKNEGICSVHCHIERSRKRRLLAT